MALLVFFGCLGGGGKRERERGAVREMVFVWWEEEAGLIFREFSSTEQRQDEKGPSAAGHDGRGEVSGCEYGRGRLDLLSVGGYVCFFLSLSSIFHLPVSYFEYLTN